MKDLKEICEKDNRLQKMLMNGQITKETFNKEKQKIHDDYVDATMEQELLKNLMAKHGGQ